MFDIVGVGQLMKKKAGSAKALPLQGFRLIKQKNRKYLLILLGLPLASLALYFYAIGRDRYFVRSEVAVRKANESVASGLSLGSLLGGGNQQSLEDARFLRTYLESPQVLEDLGQSFDFKEAYAKRFPDLYPGITSNSTREKIYDTFRKQINVSLNEQSGQLTIRTLAFDPSTALKFNKFLIRKAEEFVNRLNQDVYKQQLVFAQQQAELNRKRVREASKALLEFQDLNNVLDARSEAQGKEAFITALEAELAKKRVELATLRRQFLDQRAPEIEAVQAQVQELQRQIQRERSSLVSPQGKNLNDKAAKQAELEANLEFASDLYKASITAAEKTRVDSLQQQRFMAVLSNPLRPEEPWQYWRHRGFFTALAILLVGFTLTKFLLGMADSHRN